jgi:hypothetical protein
LTRRRQFAGSPLAGAFAPERLFRRLNLPGAATPVRFARAVPRLEHEMITAYYNSADHDNSD